MHSTSEKSPSEHRCGSGKQPTFDYSGSHTLYNVLTAGVRASGFGQSPVEKASESLLRPAWQVGSPRPICMYILKASNL